MTELPEGYSLFVVLDRITRNFLNWDEKKLREALELAFMIKKATNEQHIINPTVKNE